jgi:hypothetical protein
LVVPGVSPEFQVGGDVFGLLFSEIVKDDLLLPHVAIPPFVLELLVCLWEFLFCRSGLASACLAVKPFAYFFLSSLGNFLVVFSYLAECPIVFDSNLCRD